MKSSAPASNPLTRSATESKDVNKIKNVVDNLGSFLMALHTSIPLNPGIIQSHIIKAGGESRVFKIPSSPVFAVIT